MAHDFKRHSVNMLNWEFSSENLLVGCRKSNSKVAQLLGNLPEKFSNKNLADRIEIITLILRLANSSFLPKMTRKLCFQDHTAQQTLMIHSINMEQWPSG